jgi:osmoprotectant transport system substrate-binding protein
MLRAVAAEDAPQGISWVDMAPANNTYALAVGPGTEQRYGFKSLSDLAAFARSNPAEATVCMGTEFASRTDGWQGVSKHYGINLPAANLKLMSDATVFPAMAAGNPCLFGVLSTTDGRISALKLTVLADDQKFFPKYNVSACISSDLLRRYPRIADVLKPVMDKVTDDEMIKLNSEADVTGRDWSAIALDWLVRNGFVTDAGRS